MRLASGGPRMIVLDVTEAGVECGWPEGEATFPAVCLRAS